MSSLCSFVVLKYVMHMFTADTLFHQIHFSSATSNQLITNLSWHIKEPRPCIVFINCFLNRVSLKSLSLNKSATNQVKYCIRQRITHRYLINFVSWAIFVTRKTHFQNECLVLCVLTKKSKACSKWRPLLDERFTNSARY